jgi:hypothetical protein
LGLEWNRLAQDRGRMVAFCGHETSYGGEFLGIWVTFAFPWLLDGVRLISVLFNKNDCGLPREAGNMTWTREYSQRRFVQSQLNLPPAETSYWRLQAKAAAANSISGRICLLCMFWGIHRPFALRHSIVFSCLNIWAGFYMIPLVKFTNLKHCSALVLSLLYFYSHQKLLDSVAVLRQQRGCEWHLCANGVFWAQKD